MWRLRQYVSNQLSALQLLIIANIAFIW
jgi:hypothetical protein